jgi:hypothetical protein
MSVTGHSSGSSDAPVFQKRWSPLLVVAKASRPPSSGRKGRRRAVNMPGRIAECRCVSTIHAAYSKRPSVLTHGGCSRIAAPGPPISAAPYADTSAL